MSTRKSSRPHELRRLLEVHVLEKVLCEVGYELNNRPDWVAIPLRGILGMFGKTASRDPAGGGGV